jgi:hypothetical protein
LINAAENEKDMSTLQNPRLIVSNGLTGSFQATEKHLFVNGLSITHKDHGLVVLPQTETVTTGLVMSLSPRVTAPDRTIRLALRASMTQLAPEVPLYPVSLPIPSAKGERPVPFTNYIQEPSVSQCKSNVLLDLADGHTAILSGWKSSGCDGQNVYVLVTPRILTGEKKSCETTCVAAANATSQAAGEEEEATPWPEPKPSQPSAKDRKLARLLRRYEEACSEGRLEDARKLARRALVIDPSCFSRKAGKPPKTEPLADPNERVHELLKNSDHCGQMQLNSRIWFTDQPSRLTPERVDGGIE